MLFHTNMLYIILYLCLKPKHIYDRALQFAIFFRCIKKQNYPNCTLSISLFTKKLPKRYRLKANQRKNVFTSIKVLVVTSIYNIHKQYFHLPIALFGKYSTTKMGDLVVYHKQNYPIYSILHLYLFRIQS